MSVSPGSTKESVQITQIKESQHFAFAVINHLLKLLILSVHEGFPLLKEFRFRVLDVLQSPLSLDGAIFHGNNLIIATHTKEDRKNMICI